MFTKKNATPLSNKCRYYKLFIESDDTTAKITTVDKALEETTVSATTIHFPTGFRTVSFLTDIHNIGGTVTNYNADVRLFADGSQGATLPPLVNYDYMTMYVYGYFDR